MSLLVSSIQKEDLREESLKMDGILTSLPPPYSEGNLNPQKQVIFPLLYLFSLPSGEDSLCILKKLNLEMLYVYDELSRCGLLTISCLYGLRVYLKR